MSVTKQRTATDYKHHFDELFNCLEYATFDQFQSNFPSDISDFSAAEQGGFKMELTKYFNKRCDGDTNVSNGILQVLLCKYHCILHNLFSSLIVIQCIRLFLNTLFFDLK
jgi:hypothetical protein